ncbi:MAG: guanylate kinase [Planctomycetota bacterium]
MTGSAQSGRIVIVSGPSGAGKSTVLRRLLDQAPWPLALSVSATTRSPRPGERDGVDYYFLSKDDFAARRARDEFLEWKEVFGRGDWYGTLWSQVTTGLQQGKWLILEIDVAGAMTVVERYPDAITIFLHPGSIDELERRLRGRGTESAESLQRRLEVARQEIEYLPRYQHSVVNDDPDRSAQEIIGLLRQYAGST